ncbi:MAG: hypothetical protein EPN39_00180 [Chitinophagaceae bacterium]|nr:MAG: hypothetical protein EPN39_00180 [Chitinophagaceae bacterium]
MKKSTLIEIISVLMALLWAYAACSKLVHYETFKGQLNNSPFLYFVSGLLAIAVPLIEIGIALLLMINNTRVKGLYLSVILLSLFIIYIIAILNFAPRIPCSCGGLIQALGWKGHIFFNLFFIIIGIIAIKLSGDKENRAYPTKLNSIS